MKLNSSPQLKQMQAQAVVRQSNIEQMFDSLPLWTLRSKQHGLRGDVLIGYLLFLLVLSALPIDANARGFRGFQPIATEQTLSSENAESRQVQLLNQANPVSHTLGEHAVKQLVQAWNQDQLSDVLSENFYDKSQLLDAMAADVPKDARLRLLSVRGVQTLSQRVETDPQYGQVLVSQISATANTQIEYNDPANGSFVNRPGTNEFILEVRQRMGE